ncbi:ATPase ASNA1-like protein [Dinothrombium tinctorium]|uniref:ATPase ASNA1-like protein n=1 Tax=Dinothrombium tinctorium TaxID=1965070 RepID=A0A3S3QZP8_9ACAR|nr:ATPase ASNA1-like protein [Dinothrombium tinctorium]
MDETSEERNLRKVIEDKELKWVFVGGKGGVGKTTCSCSIAIEFAKRRTSVLIISTDPAHNVSDAFNQKLSKTPVPIIGFDNLFGMEIDPSPLISGNGVSDLLGASGGSGSWDGLLNETNIGEMLQSFPGIDEAMSYIQVMKLVNSFHFDIVIFDTAPTGHTLRLLSLPATIEKSFAKILNLKSTLSPIFNSFSSMFAGVGGNSGEAAGGAPDDGRFSADSITSKMEELMPTIRQINKEFADASKTTFICVAIPEFLSLYETERLIQNLAKCKIDCRTIIVNQILMKESERNVLEVNENEECKYCLARMKIQRKYLQQFIDLYEEDFTLVFIPQLLHEVRGKEQLLQFAKFLLK